MYDLATGCRYAFPTDRKNEAETTKHIRFMLGTDKCQLAYADGWKSFQPSLDALGINFEQSQPGVHQTNGVIEAINQDIAKATRCLLENGVSC